MLVTGSRIPQVVDPAAEFPGTISPVRVVSRADLQQTGRPDLGSALNRTGPM
jgi:hypothetical protein